MNDNFNEEFKNIESDIYRDLTSNEIEFDKGLKEICPKAIEDKTLSLVISLLDFLLIINYSKRESNYF